VTCSNGTDALVMALMSLELGGHSVALPSFTFAATAEAVVLAGGTPLFVEVDPETFNIDPASLESVLERGAPGGEPVGAIVAVDLFGQPADYSSLREIADRHGLKLIADAAQSFGATYQGSRVGTLADVTTTSFFPAKPLGCYGDGGAVFTNDAELDAILRSIRVHGQGRDKYDNARVGLNARLDTMQAAILLEKLKIFDREVVARQLVADRYRARLEGHVNTPAVLDGATSVWAQFTVQISDRDRVREALARADIPTAIYYPIPLHLSTAYGRFADGSDLGVSERLSREVLSLPMHPYLSEGDQDRIVEAMATAVATSRSSVSE
jgi:dTDP-4-amino-4,6-dideoxygalactose transaminase